MRKVFVILLLLMITQLHAQQRIGAGEAFITAERFMKQNAKQNAVTLVLTEEIKSKTSEQTNLFVFSMEPQGFVIVSATNEILAYSFGSSLPYINELPAHISYWTDLYNEQTDYLLQHPDRFKKRERQQHTVEPLLTSIWGQGCYHNFLCPIDISGPCQHVSAGCVAVAMAQIMYYHKLPLKGNGLMTYDCPPYGTLSANFSSTTYNWEGMADTLIESNSAVAKLILHCGISVEMKYGAHTSISSTTAALNAFQQFFFYPLSIRTNRNNISDEEWMAMIRQDIDNQLPVYYAGTSDLGPHAFVCDGYDGNGLFHFNFGWDGVADGYYTLENPSGFSITQSCIHNITPLANLPIQSDSHGIVYVSADGHGDGSSWENATCDLQAAIYKANVDKVTVWVKEGTYTRESTAEHAFNSFGSCQLYGGFKGDESYDYDLSLRDFEAHPSILDGNHSNGVLRIQYAFNPVLIDGFTIQNGTASQGGGIHVRCQTRIKHCKFLYNYSRANGGGLLQQSSSNQTIIEDCIFEGNEAMSYGGAAYDVGNTIYRRCLFHDNHAQSDGGGVYSNTYTPNQFVSCTFSNNTAKNGGGIAITQSETVLWNCLINNNTAETGGGCYLKAGANLYNCTIVKNEAQTDYGGVYVSPSPIAEIQNCIIWGNVSAGENGQIGSTNTYSYCAVENDFSGDECNYKAETDNDGSLPNFYVRFRNANVAPGAIGHGGDWQLQPNSLCINKGAILFQPPLVDLNGNPRCLHKKIDLGAYESDVATYGIIAYYCEEDPYYYQDSILSELGLYTFLYPTPYYDSLVIVDIQLPGPAIFLSEEICDNETYDFFGTLLNESGNYTHNDNCTTYRLTLRVKPLTVIAMQEEICDGEPYDFFGELLYEEGHYSTQVDCRKYELDLIVNPYVPILMEEEICEGETYDFFGRHLSHSGHYYATVQCTDYQLDLTVNTKPALQCSHDTLVEFANPVMLTATGADTYLWSTGDTTQNITVYPVMDEQYTVQGFSKSGCTASASVNVRIIQENEEIVLFPNPANDKVRIHMPFIEELEVFNILGDRKEQIHTNCEVTELNVSAYPAGVYVVHARLLDKHFYKKLIVRH